MKKQTQKTKSIALMGILSAIILLMSFTPIGYLHLGTIEISLLMIPVALGAIALGPVAGAFLGALFGLTSFIQCFGSSPFGAFMLDLNPILTFFMCFIPRILAGFCTGLVAQAFKSARAKTAKKGKAFNTVFGVSTHAITGLLAAGFNTLFFMSALLLFCWNNQKFIDQMSEWGMPINNIMKFFIAFVGINCVFELIATCVFCGAIGTALEKANLISFDKKSAKDTSDDEHVLMGDVACPVEINEETAETVSEQ